MGAAVVASIAGARPSGLADLRPVAGSGTLTFSGKGTFGTVKGTVTTKVVPSSITAGEPARFTMEISWTETGQSPQCASGTNPGQTHPTTQFPMVTIRPGHGEDLAMPRIVDAVGDVTVVWGDGVLTCGATDTFKQTDSYDARVSGALTKGYVPSCVAPYPSAGTNVFGNLGPDATYEGTFATLSIGGGGLHGSCDARYRGPDLDRYVHRRRTGEAARHRGARQSQDRRDHPSLGQADRPLHRRRGRPHTQAEDVVGLAGRQAEDHLLFPHRHEPRGAHHQSLPRQAHLPNRRGKSSPARRPSGPRSRSRPEQTPGRGPVTAHRDGDERAEDEHGAARAEARDEQASEQ